MFVRKFILPVLAVAGVAFAVYTVRSSSRPVVSAPPVAEPAKSGFAHPVAGAGIVEASTQNIAVGTNVAGIVTKVFVKVGDSVKEGDPLFKIDDRTLAASLVVREAAVAAARRALALKEAQPRPEDVPPAEARVAEMQSTLEDAQSQLEMYERAREREAGTADELLRRRFLVSIVRARLTQAKGQLDLLKAGTYGPEIEVARAQVASAEAELAAVRTEVERLTVRSPIAGQVLQVNVRAGEFAPAGAMTGSAVLMYVGATDVLHVRVDIDENDAMRIRPGDKATASPRGNSGMKVELAFVRIEPYVVPKKSLTGDSSERVDTRVLQVLYAFERTKLPVYVGQQMDVFVDAGE